MNQPSNSLINHLGLTNFWYSYPMYSYKYTRYTFLNIININYYLQILFKNGIIYTFHLFYHNYFFQIIQLLTLPVYITQWTFAKFYRWYKIKNLKKRYLLRRYIQFMHVSMIYFYKFNNWLLVSMHIYIPHIIKWKKKNLLLKWYWLKQSTLIIKIYQFYLFNYYFFHLYNYL
jgi:hypothetical protein